VSVGALSRERDKNIARSYDAAVGDDTDPRCVFIRGISVNFNQFVAQGFKKPLKGLVFGRNYFGFCLHGFYCLSSRSKVSD